MADAVARFPLMVAGISERGVRAVTSAAPDWPFWLPRAGHVTWSPAPKVGETSVATNPHWLAQKHKQLWQLREVASVASESTEHANTRKENAMANGKDMAGALFKNTKRENDNQPLYKGDATIDGRKFWISSWLKTAKNGETYMSLAFRPADQPGDISKPNPKPTPAEEEIPF